MYARILIYAAAGLGKADRASHLAQAFKRSGHVVSLRQAPARAEDTARALASALRAFKPSLIIWQESHFLSDDVTQILRECDCCKMLLYCGCTRHDDHTLMEIKQTFDYALCDSSAHPSWLIRAFGTCIIDASPLPDKGYLHADVSTPNPKRTGIAVSQMRTQAREDDLNEFISSNRQHGLLAMHPSWPDCLQTINPMSCEAYHLRKTRYFVLFEAENEAPSLSTLAARIAEGVIVAVDNTVRKALPDGPIKDAVIPFSKGELAGALAPYEQDRQKLVDIQQRQHNALGSYAALERNLDAVLGDLDMRYVAQGRSRLLPLVYPACPVVLFGWFGAKSFGDDLLMHTVAEKLERRYRSVQVQVIGVSERTISLEYGYDAATPDDRGRVRSMIKDARAVVFCGGLVFDVPMADTAGEMEFMLDPYIEPTGQASISLLASLYGATPVYLGIGAGPVDHEATRLAIQLMDRAHSLFLPRDEQSRDLLISCGCNPERVECTADLAFASHTLLQDADVEQAPVAGEQKASADSTEDAPDEPELVAGVDVSKPFYVVSLRSWPTNPHEFTNTIAKVLTRVSEETDMTAVLMPFDAEDTKLHKEVASRIPTSCRTVFIDKRPDTPEFLRILTESRGCLAMRLHCAVMHHAQGKPAVGLDYNEKIQAHFNELGQGDLLVPIDASADMIAGKAIAALTRGVANKQSFEQALGHKSFLADNAFDRLYQTIDAYQPREESRTIFYPREVSAAAQRNEALQLRLESMAAESSDLECASQRRIEELEGQCAELKDKVKQAEAEHLKITSSNSYLLGSILTAPLRFFRRITKRKP